MRELHPAQVLVHRGPDEAALREDVQRSLHLREDVDALAVECRLLLVAELVVRREVLGGHLLSQAKDGGEGVASVLGVAVPGRQRLHVQPFVQQELEIPSRHQRWRHRVPFRRPVVRPLPPRAADPWPWHGLSAEAEPADVRDVLTGDPTSIGPPRARGDGTQVRTRPIPPNTSTPPRSRTPTRTFQYRATVAARPVAATTHPCGQPGAHPVGEREQGRQHQGGDPGREPRPRHRRGGGEQLVGGLEVGDEPHWRPQQVEELKDVRRRDRRLRVARERGAGCRCHHVTSDRTPAGPHRRPVPPERSLVRYRRSRRRYAPLEWPVNEVSAGDVTPAGSSPSACPWASSSTSLSR